MTNFNIKESFDDTKIKNINQANWFKTMNQFPRTISHMRLLISIVDKIGIFNKYDLIKTSTMDKNKLNIIYAVLRIMNKVFNKYLDHIVKNIFRDGLKELFSCSHLTYYDLFFDQLTQDLDHFACLIIKTHYPKLDEEIIKFKLINYLDTTFKKTFYENIMKKLGYDNSDNFYIQHENIFIHMAQDFIKYTRQTLTETYETMKIFLDKIFNPQCSKETVDDIITALKKHIDLKNLFKETCMEIDIYSEQKLDDELELSEIKTPSASETKILLANENDLSADINYINNIVENIGYRIHISNQTRTNAISIFQPFIEHNLVSSNEDMLAILLSILIDYRTEPYIIDKNSSITLENYYEQIVQSAQSAQSQSLLQYFNTYEDLCNLFIDVNRSFNFYPLDIILPLTSRIFNAKIKLVRQDLHVMEIDNTNNLINDNLSDDGLSEKMIVIYVVPENNMEQNSNMCYTLCDKDVIFKPILEYPQPVNEIIKFLRNIKKSKHQAASHDVLNV